MLKKYLKRLLPKKIYLFLRAQSMSFKAYGDYFHDTRRFIEYSSSALWKYRQNNIEARILAHTHVIEKGLSLKKVRLEFGKEIIASLFDLMDMLDRRGCAQDNFYMSVAVCVLNEYVVFHKKKQKKVMHIEKELMRYKKYFKKVPAGTVSCERAALQKKAQSDYRNLAETRYSVRQFKKEPVDIKILEDIVHLANRAPSSCNRQPSKVHLIQDEEKLKQILEIQQGSKGFGTQAASLLIVTVDLSGYCDPIERNMPFIDGGLFTMSLLYAIHYRGLGACCLNWSVSNKKDHLLRGIVGLKDCETVVALILIGHLPDNFDVATSKRKNLGEVLRIIAV